MESEASPWSGLRATCQIGHSKSTFWTPLHMFSMFPVACPRAPFRVHVYSLFILVIYVVFLSFSISFYLRMTLICYVAGNDLQSLTTNININLGILFDWFCANKLSLNLKKTNYILFHHRAKPIPFDWSLYLNGIIINRVSKCRFFGCLAWWTCELVRSY